MMKKKLLTTTVIDKLSYSHFGNADGLVIAVFIVSIQVVSTFLHQYRILVLTPENLLF
jgi:hypothetical protein